MNVELPDGTVIEDVPEGMSQGDLLRKLFDAKHPAYYPLAKQMMKDNQFGSGVPKFAYELGGKVTDAAKSIGLPDSIAAGAGYVANVGTQAIPALLGSFRFAGDAPVSLAEKPARVLMQSAIKPVQADRLSGDAGRAIGTMLQQDISPTMSGMDKATKLANALDVRAENAVAASPEMISANAVGQRLIDSAKRAVTQVNPQGDIEAVKSVWQNFRDSPLVQQQAVLQAGATPVNPSVAGAASSDVSLPVQLAHALKKGTYQSLGGKAYGEVGSVSTEAQKALARGLREEVAAAVPDAAEALKGEAALRNVLDVARNRAILEANKNPMGLAALRLDNPLSSAGFLADRSAYVKGLLGRLLYRGAQPQMALPYATAGGAIEERLKQ